MAGSCRACATCGHALFAAPLRVSCRLRGRRSAIAPSTRRSKPLQHPPLSTVRRAAVRDGRSPLGRGVGSCAPPLASQAARPISRASSTTPSRPPRPRRTTPWSGATIASPSGCKAAPAARRRLPRPLEHAHGPVLSARSRPRWPARLRVAWACRMRLACAPRPLSQWYTARATHKVQRVMLRPAGGTPVQPDLDEGRAGKQQPEVVRPGRCGGRPAVSPHSLA